MVPVRVPREPASYCTHSEEAGKTSRRVTAIVLSAPIFCTALARLPRERSRAFTLVATCPSQVPPSAGYGCVFQVFASFAFRGSIARERKGFLNSSHFSSTLCERWNVYLRRICDTHSLIYLIWADTTSSGRTSRRRVGGSEVQAVQMVSMAVSSIYNSLPARLSVSGHAW